MEQSILNLSKVVGNFVEEQKGINVQLAQMIDTIENTLNKRIDGLESNLNQKIDNLQYSITKINKLLEVQERERFPSQTLPNPKGIHEVGSSNNSGMDEVKAIITLRSGKEVDQPMPKPVEESRQGEKLQSEHILLKEDSMKYRIPPPFPQALRGKKKASQQAGILEVLRQVKVNIPLLDVIKQVPAYEKFLKDLCTIKKGLGIEKKAFLTEQVSAIIQSKYPVKYKDPGSPTISVNIGGNCIDKSFLDLGAYVNLMPYSIYKQLGLGELKPTNITLSLADRSVKIPKGIVEDVLVKIDKFYYPVDFVVLDTEPISSEPNHVPIILGRPVLATSNAIINCRNGFMQLTFGNMTLELNIFHLGKRHMHSEEDDFEEVCILDTILEEQANGQQMQDLLTSELSECLVEQHELQEMSLVQGYWRRKIEILPLLTGDEPKEPQQLELKPLPAELKYAFLEENELCPVVISSLLTTAQENNLLHLLKKNKQALGWKISDFKGINPSICTHHIYLEEESKAVRQPQRRLNPHLQEVVRVEVLKLLQAGIIYPISDST